MSEYISKEDISRVLLERIGANKSCLIRAREKELHETEQYFNNLLFEDEQISSLIEELTSADVRENIHGHWMRMSDLPQDKDDRYQCSRCGNVVHYSNGVYLYTFNSWCGSCGSLNNSLIAGLESIGEKGTE